MTGEFDDVSASTFLTSQISKQVRQNWDSTLKDMSEGLIHFVRDEYDIDNEYNAMQLAITNDILYYRTKWPWPLKDRDYSLARRCKVFNKENAVVFVSRSTEVKIS